MLRWASRKHGDKGRRWIADRYWHPRGTRKWTFCTDDNTLFSVGDIKIRRHVKTKGTMNPYIDVEYFRKRQASRKYERGYRDKDFAMS